MPYVIDTNDVVMIRAKQLLGGQKIMNVYYVRQVGANSVSLSDFHTQACNWLQGAYDIINNLLSDEWETDTIQTYDVTDDVPMYETAWPTPLSGEGVSDSLPYQNAALVTFPTEAKRSLGKKFVAGLHEGISDGAGALTSAMTAALVSFAADILAGHTSGDIDFEVGNYRSLVSQFIPYVSAIVETLISSQRRRKPGVGE